VPDEFGSALGGPVGHLGIDERDYVVGKAKRAGCRRVTSARDERNERLVDRAIA
jgi:hypothetical protein